MVIQAKDAGVALTGPDGLLKALTGEICAHLAEVYGASVS